MPRRKSLTKSRPEYEGFRGFFRAGREGLTQIGQRLEASAKRGTLRKIGKTSEKIGRRTYFGSLNIARSLKSMHEELERRKKMRREARTREEREKLRDEIETLKLEIERLRPELEVMKLRQQVNELRARTADAKPQSKLMKFLTTDWDKEASKTRKKLENS